MSATYARRLQAIGELIDRARLRDVCVTEYDHGVVVVGLSREEPNGPGAPIGPKTLTIGRDQLARLLDDAEPSGERGPFRRWGRKAAKGADVALV